MKAWFLVVLACCGCLDEALPLVEPDMAEDLDRPQVESETLCAKSDNTVRFVDWNNETLQVKCLSDYEGGWLLVARSGVGSDTTQFGWVHETGLLDIPSRPYALGRELRFTEILVAAGDSGRIISEDYSEVSRIRVASDDFVGLNGLSSVDSIEVLRFLGACFNDPSPASSFTRLGHTNRINSFWFGESDAGVLSPTGLYPEGWRFRGDSCAADGNFGKLGGAIYVRALKSTD